MSDFTRLGGRQTDSGVGVRNATGASIVAIERAGQALVNPGPDEEPKQATASLIGDAAQLAAARDLLAGRLPPDSQP